MFKESNYFKFFLFVFSFCFFLSLGKMANALSANISCSPSSIYTGNSSNFYWSSSGASSCYASGDLGTGYTSLSGGPVSTGTIYSNKTQCINCFDSSGNSTGNICATVYVYTPPPPPPPTIYSFYSSPNPIPYGASTTFYWNTNATYCSASGTFGNGTIGASGSSTVGPLYSNGTQTIACSNPGSSVVTSTNTITVSAPPSISFFYSSPNPIPYGASTNIYWSANNSSYCYSSGTFGNGYVSTSGTYITPALYSNSSQTLTCTNGYYSSTSQVTITVLPPPSPTLNFNINIQPF